MSPVLFIIHCSSVILKLNFCVHLKSSILTQTLYLTKVIRQNFKFKKQKIHNNPPLSYNNNNNNNVIKT